MNYYLFAAYSVIWTLLFLYLLVLFRSQKQVNQKLTALLEILEKRDDS